MLVLVLKIDEIAGYLFYVAVQALKFDNFFVKYELSEENLRKRQKFL